MEAGLALPASTSSRVTKKSVNAQLVVFNARSIVAYEKGEGGIDGVDSGCYYQSRDGDGSML